MRDPELPPAPELPELPLLNLLSTSAARRSTTMPLKLEVRLERRGGREERGERADMRREEKVPERWREEERGVRAAGEAGAPSSSSSRCLGSALERWFSSSASRGARQPAPRR